MQKPGSLVALTAAAALLVVAGLSWFILAPERGALAPAAGDSGTAAPAAGGSAARDGDASSATSTTAPSTDREAADRAALGALTLRGRVEQSAGLGVPDLTVVLWLERPLLSLGNFEGSLPQVAEPRVETQTTTQADGTFTLASVPAQPFYLHAQGGLYVQSEHDLIEPSRLDHPVVLRVELGGALEGRVHQGDRAIPGALVRLGNEADLVRAIGLEEDELLGAVAPVSDARMRADIERGLSRAQPRLEVVTDAAGAFRFAGIPRDRGRLITVEADRFAHYRQLNPPITPGKTVHVDIELEAGGTISGRVRASGSPLAGASVHALRSDKLIQGFLSGGFHYDRVRTDADGRYTLERVPAGSYRIEVRARDLPPQTKASLALAAGQDLTGVDFELDEGLTLAGRVLDPSGKPAAGAKVRVYKKPTPFDLMSFTNPIRAPLIATDADGRFEARGLARGVHLVRATAANLAAAQSEGEPGKEVVLQLAASAGLRGVVVATADGEIVPKYRVSVTVRGAPRPSGSPLGLNFDIPADPGLDTEGAQRTAGKDIDDPKGEFLVEGLVPGTAEIRVTADGFAVGRAQDTEIRPGEITRGVVVFLERESAIEGVVRDRVSGDAIAKASVRVALQDEGARERSRAEGLGAPRRRGAGDSRTRSDDRGRFHVGKLGAGLVQVTASADGYARSEPAQVRVAAARITPDVVIELDRAGAVEGVVLGAAGKPRKGAVLMASRKAELTEAFDREPAITDGDGHFEMKNLPPGPLNLLLVQGDVELSVTSVLSMLGKRQVVPVVVTAGETTHVEIREEGAASNGCRVFGTVRSGERTLPLALVAASAEQLGTLEQVGLRTATTDENGAYQLLGLPPGRYRFSIVSSNGEESGALPVEIPQASEAHRDLLVPAGQVVGTVVDRSSNAPVGGALVQLQPSGTASDVLSLQVALEARANRTFSDDQGRFRIAGVAPGLYTLHAGGPASRASARDYSMTSLPDVVVKEGQPTPLTVSLVPGAVVIGRVTDQQRAPLEGVSILLRAPDGGAVDFSPGTRTNGDGRYRYTGVSPGKFMLYAQWEGQVVQATDVFEVKDGAQVQRDITLARGIPVTVRLKGIPLIEISDYDVELQDSEGRTYRRILTREQIARFLFGNNTPGEYTVGPFPPGTYSVVVKKNGATVYTQSATLADPAGETFEVSSAGIQKVPR